ncbi:choline-binding transcriptional repressor BetI [Aestuariispira ectoiniformans]|uniref:choline-binding transcriptional repressor BetI n=1 Tax=Aestuariispira ectoiniformans TaxID=2775080 RepID=UPI00223BA264|nr:transcriptional regulator BetI [Aestuariispira ectoiniformans]
MPKLGMEPIRRKQLIEATIASINEMGFANTTVKQISQRAGVSTGIIHHYFGGKEDLLEATMRKLLEDLREITAQGLARQSDPHQRLITLIKANFADELFSSESSVAWLAFWAQVPHSARFRRLQRINERRVLSNLRRDLKKLIPAEKVTETALAIAVFMDGMWIRCAINRELVTVETARRQTLDFLELQLARYGQ